MVTYPVPHRGEVWLVCLDPTRGHEVKKTRPAIVVTNDAYNENNWVVIVMPLTSSSKAEYDQVVIKPPEGGLAKSSVTLPDQLRAVDRARLVQQLGSLSPKTLEKVDRSLRMVLDV